MGRIERQGRRLLHPVAVGEKADPRIRVLIVDDHRLFADAIRSALASMAISVVGTAGTAQEALVMVRRERPDLVLVDLGLPDQSGLLLGKAILEEYPETKVLALTALDDPRAVEEALRIGFTGYLTKDTPVAQFSTSVALALEGQVVVPHRLAAAAARGSARDHFALLAAQLTSREREVLALLVGGLSGRRIASDLGITTNTVRTHVQSILNKLQVHSRLEAAAFAVRHGLAESRESSAAPRLMRST